MFLWIAIMVLAVFLDQLTKYLTVLCLKPIPTFPIIEDVLHLTYVENPGAAFGMMKDQRWLFMVVSCVAIVALLIYLFKKKSQYWLENLAIAFIVGGGIGNMIDRVVLGYVVDMIDFRLIDFAVFNVADSFVCVGAGLLMLYIILAGVQEYKEEKARKRRFAEWDLEEEALTENMPVADIPAEDISAEGASAEDISAEGASAEDISAEDASTEDALAEDTPVEDTPAEEASAEDTPTEEETHA